MSRNILYKKKTHKKNASSNFIGNKFTMKGLNGNKDKNVRIQYTDNWHTYEENVSSIHQPGSIVNKTLFF